MKSRLGGICSKSFSWCYKLRPPVLLIVVSKTVSKWSRLTTSPKNCESECWVVFGWFKFFQIKSGDIWSFPHTTRATSSISYSFRFYKFSMMTYDWWLTSELFHVSHSHSQNGEFVRFPSKGATSWNHVRQLGDVGRHLVSSPPLNFAMILPTVICKKRSGHYIISQRQATTIIWQKSAQTLVVWYF